MWRRIRENLDSGVEKVKWFASLLNERVRIEVSVMQLLHRSNEMEKQRIMLLKTIGEKFFELRKSPERHIRENPVIIEAMGEIERLDAEIENLKKKADDIGRVEP